MKNYLDYLSYYGNESFFSVAYNEVDALIFGMLSYVQFDDIVPVEKNQSILLKEACEKFINKHTQHEKGQDWMFEITFPMVQKLATCSRYGQVRLFHYVNKIDANVQFGALTIRLPNGITYISFEGTDSSVVGWKEDLEIVYSFPIASQTLARDYLNDTIRLFDRAIYIGGHSKGGNLAMYAAMYCHDSLKKRIKQVYNFDGPGFLKNVIESEEYQKMAQKLTMIVPESSVVGVFLFHGSYRVVPSSGYAIMQHDSSTWEVFGGYFVEGKLSRKSEKLKNNLMEYIESMSLEERRLFVETSFAVLEKTNITNIMQLKDIKISTLLNLMKEIKNVPAQTKHNFIAILRLLITGMT